jgi:hypothetical protein
MVIIIVLKFNSIVNLGQCLGYELRELTQINVRIKIIIIIILKLDTRVNPRQGSGYESGGLTWLTQKFLKKIKGFFTYILSRVARLPRSFDWIRSTWSLLYFFFYDSLFFFFLSFLHYFCFCPGIKTKQ